MLRLFLSLTTLVALTIVLGIPALIVSLISRRSHAVMRAGRLWARGILAVMGVRPQIHGLENLEPLRNGATAVLVANHMSMVDVFLLVMCLPAHVHFVAKQSLFQVPLFGLLLRVAGFIAIDRSNRQRAIASLREAADRIRSGFPVLVFAEGTRSRDGKLAPFKKGAFHLALQAGAPVIPVSISGTWSIVQPGGLEVRPGTAHVHFGNPIPVPAQGTADINRLILKVRRTVAARLAPEELHPADWTSEAQAR